jgi:hypothetical protein
MLRAAVSLFVAIALSFIIARLFLLQDVTASESHAIDIRSSGEMVCHVSNKLGPSQDIFVRAKYGKVLVAPRQFQDGITCRIELKGISDTDEYILESVSCTCINAPQRISSQLPGAVSIEFGVMPDYDKREFRYEINYVGLANQRAISLLVEGEYVPSITCANFYEQMADQVLTGKAPEFSVSVSRNLAEVSLDRLFILTELLSISRQPKLEVVSEDDQLLIESRDAEAVDYFGDGVSSKSVGMLLYTKNGEPLLGEDVGSRVVWIKINGERVSLTVVGLTDFAVIPTTLYLFRQFPELPCEFSVRTDGINSLVTAVLPDELQLDGSPIISSTECKYSVKLKGKSEVDDSWVKIIAGNREAKLDVEIH